jgi:pantothenate kinase-related protein Tda10
MDFDLEKDLSIFDDFFEKRPEVDKDQLKQNLEHYYIPYVKKLIGLKKAKTSSDGIIVGVSAIQGAGKTTQGEILEILLKHFGYASVSRSIDDHYITHQQLCELRKQDPRFIRRGVTHDIPLAILDLSSLQKMTDQPVVVSGYDKGAHHGDGDRFRWVNLSQGVIVKATISQQPLIVDKAPTEVLALKLTELSLNNQEILLSEKMGSLLPIIEPLLSPQLVGFLTDQTDQEVVVEMVDEDNVRFKGKSELTVTKKSLPNGWRVIEKKPDFIFYDGWMLGARMVEDEAIFSSGLPALEKTEDQMFAKMVNKKLENYYPLWQMFEFLNVLYVKNYEMSLKWRDQAEEALRAKGGGMTHDQIVEFVHYFWRSVHPGIHIKNLAQDHQHTDQVVIINDDHSVGEIYTPETIAKVS